MDEERKNPPCWQASFPLVKWTVKDLFGGGDPCNPHNHSAHLRKDRPPCSWASVILESQTQE